MGKLVSMTAAMRISGAHENTKQILSRHSKSLAKESALVMLRNSVVCKLTHCTYLQQSGILPIIITLVPCPPVLFGTA